MRGFISGIVIGLAIGVIIAAKTAPEYKKGPENKLRNANIQLGNIANLSLASAFSSTMPITGDLGPILVKRLKKISNGSIIINFYEPEALIPTHNLFDAVSSGAVDTALSSSRFWSHKSPAFELFSSVPFGPDMVPYLTWFRQHGGQKLYENLYSRHNIHSMVCGITGAAGAGWFNHEITTLNDLRKSKIAASGLISKVYTAVGATTVKIKPSNFLSWLKLEKVNAVAFSTPATDLYLGLSKYAKYYYFPGWFQQASFIDLMFNLTKWKNLSTNQRKMIESACMANITHSMAANEAVQFDTLKKIVISGVEVRRFPPDIIRTLKSSWLSVANSQSTSNTEFKQILESLREFRRDYSIWQDLEKI
jgi:TRAP-type mannitol/chloroaromatic compound transport system substrate-binding protein